MATVTVTPAVPAIEAPSSVVLNEGIAKPKSQGGLHEVNTRRECCNCPFCAMPRILSLAIEKGAFADPTPAPIPTSKSARRISMATAGRHLSNLDTLLKRGMIGPEKHETEVAALKARLE